MCAIPDIGTNQILIDPANWIQLISRDLGDAFATTAHALLETDQYLSSATTRVHHHDDGAHGGDPGTMER